MKFPHRIPEPGQLQGTELDLGIGRGHAHQPASGWGAGGLGRRWAPLRRR
jgi:hypothetical protein